MGIQKISTQNKAKQNKTTENKMNKQRTGFPWRKQVLSVIWGLDKQENLLISNQEIWKTS